MALGRPILIAALASTLVAAQDAPPPDRAVDVKRAVFDLCPKILAGNVSLDDPTQLAAIGYKGTPPRDTPGGRIPRAETGEGATKIVIAGHGGNNPSCGVWFGGPDNRERVGEMLTEAGKLGYGVSPPASLGDGTMILKVSRKSPASSFAVIMADAGGEFGGHPATTITYLN
ncbi:hypothetical protein [Sphingomonas sp.]|uniref:hypothetical protein n=1 Tax=Sphingomonas sp. TaxID=28214 RepID=UPI003D6D46D3